MSDIFQQPKKATLLRSFEADVARTLNVAQEEAETAVVQKNAEYQQKRVAVKKVGNKRFFYLTAGLIMLVIGIVLVSVYFSFIQNRRVETALENDRNTVQIEISPSVMGTLPALLPSQVAYKGISEIVLARNNIPASPTEITALLPLKKGDGGGALFSELTYGIQNNEEDSSLFLIVKETTLRTPALPAAYDDAVLTLGVNLLDFDEETKTLLMEERFTQTHMNNIPVRLMNVTTEAGIDHGILIARIPETQLLLITTKRTFQNGLLQVLHNSPLVLSL